jgi:hypothetical protein
MLATFITNTTFPTQSNHILKQITDNWIIHLQLSPLEAINITLCGGKLNWRIPLNAMLVIV